MCVCVCIVLSLEDETTTQFPDSGEMMMPGVPEQEAVAETREVRLVFI